MANNIRDLRIDMAMTQERLCDIVNRMTPPLPYKLDLPTLSKLENDVVRPTPELETRLCVALQARPVELWGEWRQIDIHKDKAAVSAEIRKKIDAPFEIIELVHELRRGQANAKTRAYLCRELDISDRELRRRIAKAAEYNYLIGNSQDGKGYYLIDNVEDGERYLRQEESRALKNLRKLKPLRRYVEGKGIAE